jgi:hypothetical protein
VLYRNAQEAESAGLPQFVARFTNYHIQQVVYVLILLSAIAQITYFSAAHFSGVVTHGLLKTIISSYYRFELLIRLFNIYIYMYMYVLLYMLSMKSKE